MSMNLKAEVRSAFTRSAVRELRLAKKVPAVVYGKAAEPLAIALERKDALRAIQHPNALLQLEIPGQPPRQVVLHAVERHPLDRSVLAVDFHQVNAKEKIKAFVHIVPLPDPEGKTIPYQMFLHELHVESLPDRIPASIELDLAPVRGGKPILVQDLPVPKDVHVLNRPDEVVAAPFHPAASATQEEAG
ncbi:50S ribosomal protein L25 [Cohnella caldifontis]|uniref:50S ribosomal protein L25 n=1 Tax=Cohnella caldifontis TaxID=3027471 RepID=UPI0023EB156D|nr:50S ribosomal protein L25 [Cohnella sp. YIM B05605]